MNRCHGTVSVSLFWLLQIRPPKKITRSRVKTPNNEMFMMDATDHVHMNKFNKCQETFAASFLSTLPASQNQFKLSSSAFLLQVKVLFSLVWNTPPPRGLHSIA
ncbi:hypothetical protein NE237_030415 [Protea cynaroides]|uniref:Uncharacterized protein n=1 Tax=Protea cynaroides TaxID=273540 RepID=A0A9Q0JX71_9MAGN|nr:hypothetical protein NE237_030415 [Protea cynaroides]